CPASPATRPGRDRGASWRSSRRRDAPRAADRTCRRTNRCASQGHGEEARCVSQPLYPLPLQERAAPARAEFSRSDLPRAAHAILEAGQLLDAHRPARMETAGGDADLSAEAELAAIAELGPAIVQHHPRI